MQIGKITLFLCGGVAQMESEPPSWRAELIMAAVGPATSLAPGFVFLVICSGGLINGLWLAFIGWYLNNAALLS